MPKIVWRQVRTRGLLPDWEVALKEVAAVMNSQVKPDLLSYHNRIVAPWGDEHRPGFRTRRKMTKDEIAMYVWPTGGLGKKIWNWLSKGTDPHDIVPKVADLLWFIWGGVGSYIARTNKSGGYKGPGVATGHLHGMKAVRHPGNEPRNFETWIWRWYQKKFNRIIENAFRRGLRKARTDGKGKSLK